MKPPSDVHGYYFGWNDKGYTSEEYRPELSDGRVTEPQVYSLLHELNTSKFSSPSFCPWEIWFIPLILGCMGGSIAILVTNMVQTKTSLTSEASTTTGTIPATSAIVGIVLMGVIGFVTIMATCLFATKRARKYMAARLYHNQQIIERHKLSVFGPKECSVRMSPQGSYIAIEFNWKPRPVLTAVPQGYGLIPVGGTGAMSSRNGTNPYQFGQVAPDSFGGAADMYNQPPPSMF